jgi:hypothetical protein
MWLDHAYALRAGAAGPFTSRGSGAAAGRRGALAGGLGASAALAGGEGTWEALPGLAEVVCQAGQEHHEALRGYDAADSRERLSHVGPS